MKLPNMTPAEIDAELVGTEYNDDTANAEALRMGAITIGEAKARNDAKLNAARAIKLQRQVDELVKQLVGTTECLNMARIIMDAESRKLAGEIVYEARASLAKIKEGK